MNPTLKEYHFYHLSGVIPSLLLAGSFLSIQWVAADTTVVAWGNPSGSVTNIPAGLTNVVQIAAGNVGFFDLALKADGTVISWGDDTQGQTNVPAGLGNVVKVAGGLAHTLALKADHTIVAWGNNFSYYTNGPTGQTNVPVGLTNVVAIGAGWYHSLAIRADGTVVAWGANEYGQSTVPSNLSNVVAVTGGPARTLALKQDGTVVAWGTNFTDNASGTPYPLSPPPDLGNVTAIAAGYYHNLALREDRTVVAWGADQYGQSTVPPSLTNVVAIAAGAYFSLALRSDGTVTGWGLDAAVPEGLTKVTGISAGYYHGIALLTDSPGSNSPAPQILSQPVGVNLVVGATASLSLLATGNSPLTFQWFKGSAPLSNTTNAAYSITNAQKSDAGTYFAVVSNAFGIATSSNVAVHVFLPGKNVLISGTYMDSTIQSYLSALGHSSTIVSNPATANFDAFDALWLGIGSPAISNRQADLNSFVNRGGIILNETLATAPVYLGVADAVTFVSAAGQVIRIVDAAHPINAGLTAASLSGWGSSWHGYFSLIDSFSGLTDTGVPGRWVTIEKPVGAGHVVLTSQDISAHIRTGAGAIGPDSPKGLLLDNILRLPPGSTAEPPNIIAQPQSQTLYVGFQASLNVVAYGAAPLSYQWFKDNSPLAGATNNLLTFANARTNDSGKYSVIVSNAFGFLVSTNVALLVVPQPACAPVSAGLVSWWRGETNLLDSWGLNDGVSQTAYTTGKVGMAFNRFFTVPDSSSLRLTNAFSIEAWVNPSTLSGLLPQSIVSKFDASPIGTNSSYFLGITNNGRLVLIVSAIGSTRTNTALVAPVTLPTNQWSHVAATYNGSTLRLYINSVLVAQTNYSPGVFPGTRNLIVGGSQSGNESAWLWSGSLDEITIFNRELQPSEIQQIYQADITGKCLIAPTIVTQPQSQGVPLGEDVLLSVGVVGTRPLRYQWRFQGGLTPASVPLPGQTNSTLLLEKFSQSRTGSYFVVVSNSVGQVISSDAVLTVLPAPTCTNAPPGLISWWPADGVAFDAMGVNNPTTGAIYGSGKSGLAFSFNGSRSLLIPSSPSLNFGTNDFSIEGWIKVLPALPTGTNANVPIAEKRVGVSTSGLGYSLSLFQGRLAFWLGSAGDILANRGFFISTGPDLRDTMFHHVAVTVVRSSTNGGNLYVDGRPVLTFNPLPSRGDLSTQSPVLLGAPTITISNSFFNGLIDELAIYNRALTANEILSLRTSGAAGKCKVPPSIVQQPVNVKATVTSNTTFMVTASGSPALRYQWRRNGLALPGATNSIYTFPALAAGNYAVIVTNLFGSILSSNAVLSLNFIPIATPQSISLNEDTPTAITLGGSDDNKDALTFAIVRPPAHGILSGAPPVVIYTPVTDYNGPDSFSFKVNDGLADSAPAEVSLTVLPVNDPPIALAQTVSVDEDTPVSITLTGTDAENDALSFVVTAQPSHGSLSGQPPNLTYLPATNYNGIDSFLFKANDSKLDSAPALVTIHIRPVNDPPVAIAHISPLFQFITDETNQWILSLNNSNATVVLDASSSSDVDNDPLTYSWTEGTNALGGGILASNLFDVGPHQVILTVSDGSVQSTAQVDFDVITRSQSISLMIALIENSTMPAKNQQPLLASLKAAATSAEKGNLASAINQLRAFENKLSVQLAPVDPSLASELYQAAERIIQELSP